VEGHLGLGGGAWPRGSPLEPPLCGTEVGIEPRVYERVREL